MKEVEACMKSPLTEHAQAVVEFAIVLPVLLLLLIGLINLGFLINAQIILTQAAWEGARVGATLDPANGEGDEEINGAVQSAMIGFLDASDAGISISPDEYARTSMSWPKPRGEQLTVTLSYPVNLTLPVPITLSLGAQAISRIEYSNLP